MKKLLVFVLAAVFTLASYGCTQSENTVQESTQAIVQEQSAQGQKAESAQIKTVVSEEEIAERFNAQNPIPAEYEGMEIKSVNGMLDFALDTDTANICAYSDIIIKARVEGVEYFVDGSNPWSRFTLKVIECYRGDLSENDSAELLINSGFVTQKQIYEDTGEKDGVEWPSDEVMERTVFFVSNSEDAPPAVGNEYVFFLKQTGSSFYGGAYGSTRGDASRLLVVEENNSIASCAQSESETVRQYSEAELLQIIEDNPYNGKVNY